MHTSQLEEALAEFEDLALAGAQPNTAAFCAEHAHLPTLAHHLHLLQSLRARPNGAALQMPQSLGNAFDLLRLLGRGGMGDVYLARQHLPRRLCAVKVLQWANPRNLRRFEREANITARLEHPGIAAVLAAGHQEGVAYLALQLIYGVSVRALLQSTDLAVGDEDWLGQVIQAAADATSRDVVSTAPMPAAVAVDLAVQAAQALAYAHDAGVVHRDVKPTNLMVSTDGQVKVIDFGVAASLQDDHDNSGEPLTASGAFIGSFDYAAPEQLRGERAAVGPWSDTYALGATLFECVTQRLPFPATTLNERLLTMDAPLSLGPRQLDTAVPRALDVLIRKALEPQPRNRFEDGAALAVALMDSRAAIQRRRTSVPVHVPQPLRRLGWGALGWGVAVLCAVLGLVNHARHVQHEAGIDDAIQRRDQSVFNDVLLRYHDVFEACIDQNPTQTPFIPSVLAPRFEAVVTVHEEAVQSVEVSSYTRNLNHGARACMARALQGLEYPGVGMDTTRTLNVDVILLHAK